MRTRINNKVDVQSIIDENKRRSSVWTTAIKSKVDEFGVSWEEAKVILNRELKWVCLTREMQQIR
tara:strand:+ start:475 stop:669 length:195 start_codon:yes stop_codon:yes gene_type:complete